MKLPASPHRAPPIGKDSDSFDFSLWMATVEAKAVSREALRIAVLRDVHRCLAQLYPKYRWQSLYLFGSIVKAHRFADGSDIDIAIQGIDKDKYFEFVGAIQSRLNRVVDVVLLDECHFNASIVKTGVLWKPRAASPSF